MTIQSLLATLMITAQARAEETCDTPSLLQAKKVSVGDLSSDMDMDMEGDTNTYCAAIFHDSTASVTTCEACVTEVKGDNNLGDKVMSKSPWFVKEVAMCLLGKKAAGQTVELPGKMANRFQACSGLFGVEQCAKSVAHCTAIHADEALAAVASTATPEEQFDAVAGHEGYLSCIAHNLDHDFCLDSSMGAGNCMAAGIACIDDGLVHGSAPFQQCFGQKRAAYFDANPAQAEVYDLCDKYYGQDHGNDQIKKVALAKCGGCAMASKMDFGITNGVKCEREHCLRIPAFVQGVTQCMMNPDVPCEALNNQFVPGPFQNSVATCSAVFPLDTPGCLRNGAQCLALHPCGDSATCANDDGWFACFAKKMDTTACERHPAGMAICLKCGVGLVKNGKCDNGAHCVEQYKAGDAQVVGFHNACVAQHLR